MDSRLIIELENLKDDIKNSEEYKEFLIKEKELENNEEVQILSYKKEMAIVEYEDSLKHFAENSDEVKTAKNKLNQAISLLNSHKIVIEYNNALTKLNILLSEVEREIFGDLND
ncbi:MAG: YlbF family regulator [Bacilli bacterium]|nr:YlbF family regulator [Bacilli bacterium]